MSKVTTKAVTSKITAKPAEPKLSPAAQKKASLAADYLKYQVQAAEIEALKKKASEDLTLLLKIDERVDVPGVGYVQKYIGGVRLAWTEEGELKKKEFELEAKKSGLACMKEGADYVKGYPNRVV